MHHDQVKERLLESPDLAGLDDLSTAELVWRAEVQTFQHGEVIYAEGCSLDHTFCLLLSGDVLVESGGDITCGLVEGQVFGEMAYFTNQRVRTATIRVGSEIAEVLRFRLTPAELHTEGLSALRRFLFMRTWNRFVSTSQHACTMEEASICD